MLTSRMLTGGNADLRVCSKQKCIRLDFSEDLKPTLSAQYQTLRACCILVLARHTYLPQITRVICILACRKDLLKLLSANILAC